MSKITGVWDIPIQGISEQDYKMAIKGRVADSVNMYPSPTKGLMKRQGSHRVADLGVLFDQEVDKFHHFRSREEDYLLVISKVSGMKIYNSQGEEQSSGINSDADDYMLADNPFLDFQITSIADTTIITNKTIVVETTSPPFYGRPRKSMYFVRSGLFGHTYRIWMDYEGVSYPLEYKTPDGTDPSHTELATPAYIAKVIYDLWDADANGVKTAGIKMFLPLGSSAIMIYDTTYSPDAKDVRLRCENDTSQTETAIAINKTVESEEHLPVISQDSGSLMQGFWVEVRGRGDVDSYFLRNFNGEWKEDTSWDVYEALKHATLPVQLYDSALEGNPPYFTVRQNYWGARATGDEVTNPSPPFVGTTIQSVSTFQNRLVMLTGESICFSKSGSFFDFFRDSARSLLDTDTMSAFADTETVQILNHVSVLEGKLVVFSKDQQFTVEGKVLTPQTLALRQTNSYDSVVSVSPSNTGKSVLFSTVGTSGVEIRELRTNNLASKTLADVTNVQCPSLLSAAQVGAKLTSRDEWAVYIDTVSEYFYIYNFLDVGQERHQAAWHKWKLANNKARPIHAWFIDDKLYLVVSSDGNTYMEYIDINPFDDTANSDYEFNLSLDHKVRLSYADADVIDFGSQSQVSWDSSLMSDLDSGYLVAVRNDRFETGGIYQPTGAASTDTVIATLQSKTAGELQLAGAVYTFGVTYDASFELIRPYKTDHLNKPYLIDRMTLGRVYLSYESLGALVVDVTDTYHEKTRSKNFNATYSADLPYAINSERQSNKHVTIPIMHEATQTKVAFTTNTYLPFRVDLIEWTGQNKQRGRRT